jgi:hypothetical protein
MVPGGEDLSDAEDRANLSDTEDRGMVPGGA